MKKILQQENAAYFKLPTFEEIPDVGLYLEQTLLAVFEEQALSFETGERSEQKVMLYNIIIAVAHKIYLEKYFQLVRQRN